MQEDSDEAEETLSLCDLPLYSTDAAGTEWEEDLSTGGSTSTSSSEQDYFEFCSQELSFPTTPLPPENIIFCGKIIQQKDSKLVETNKMQGKSIFWHKFTSLFTRNGTKSPPMKKNIGKKMYNGNEEGKGCDFPVQKMSILTSSSSGKARWYLLMFGITRFSTEIELRDMKNRQSRRQSRPSSPMFTSKSGDEKVISAGRSGGKGAWELIRALSCGGDHHTDAVVTSYIPRK
ncbi:uncharacterized protein Fot_11099 [Forsythia ovata]|uniref:Uncharacterized protein n=1 Tax=Forsythia ovata TaxID=205694 RepID=A0ABD1WIS0_9LAMI